ncbi:MAG: UDP-N-acetylmuramoyl-L-alanyl-D-glutamate--2,6-diaminopimelate ligase [Dehalobacter sp. 4CP]|uniref:UDP-N-acetylmuramoyl-L-alanyl-D-glutamate--2, 6-diaminopimelate ligase n=1 Tax=Dehalobacter sp. CP TaxID=2594474 RepID=UPI0013CB6EE9|nr:UDP-N-acetylmuramoyl-L-alanyl-D-glutamate--2,6-diaminopimelate ligase [Dehalobacter sp. 4CP]
MSSSEKTLAEIIDGMKQVEVLGDTQTVINGIAHDSRTVSPGNLYVCIRGYQADGHAFAEAAVQAGATALAVEEFLPLAVPQLKFTDTRKAMGFLAAEVFGNPSDRLELVGVTGTNGKTTVTHLIERIVQQSGKKTGLIGTLGSRIGNNAYPGQHTTPESTEIQHLLAEMVAENVDLAVMEVSSHALDLGRVSGCVFNAGIFTNLTQDHLDYHKNMQEYLKAKALLFSGLNGGKAGQLAVLNADDGSCVFLKEQAGCRVVTYGVDHEADYRAVNIRLSDRGVEFDVLFHGKRTELFYSTPGKFSVYNVLAAIAWALESGYPTETVVQALHSIKGVPGRFESIRKGQPFLVIVDYAHTPDGLENVLRTAREITGGKLITVFGCGGDRDRKKRPLMGEAAGHFSDYIVVTSDNPRTEDPDEIIKDIIPGLKSANYKVIKDRRSAIDEACMAAGSGDTVLIAGKGHEDYQILGTEKIHFDDREEADKVLRRLGYVE